MYCTCKFCMCMCCLKLFSIIIFVRTHMHTRILYAYKYTKYSKYTKYTKSIYYLLNLFFLTYIYIYIYDICICIYIYIVFYIYINSIYGVISPSMICSISRSASSPAATSLPPRRWCRHRPRPPRRPRRQVPWPVFFRSTGRWKNQGKDVEKTWKK